MFSACNRYFRTSYNINEIIDIIDKSFRAIILNIELKAKDSQDIAEEEKFLRESIENFHYFALNNFVDEDGKERIVNLICDYTILLKKILKSIEQKIKNNSDNSNNSNNTVLDDTSQSINNCTSRNCRLTSARNLLTNCLCKINSIIRFCFRKVRSVWSFCVNSLYNY